VSGSIPPGVKLGYALWLAVWVPLYWMHNGPANFLWLCDAANFVVGLALFLESPLLLSSQAAGVFLIQMVWTFDFAGALLLRSHPVGGTEYMFDAATPWWLRGLSLFHVAMPVLLAWAITRLGYDRRGWLLQSGLGGALVVAGYLLGSREQNLNWVWEPFGVEQRLMAPAAWVALCLVLYPLVVYWPTHRLLLAWARRAPGVRVLPPA
jgi:hypothetical protein